LAAVDAFAKNVANRKSSLLLRMGFSVTSPSGGFPYSVVWLKKAGIPGCGDPTGECPIDGNQRQSLRKNPVASMPEQAQTGQNFQKEAGNNILWQHKKSNRRR
jgi:hypothetical protein